MSTDFFTSQDHARKQTGRLVMLFIAGVIATMVSLWAVLAALFGAGFWWWLQWKLPQLGAETLQAAGYAADPRAAGLRRVELERRTHLVDEVLGSLHRDAADLSGAGHARPLGSYLRARHITILHADRPGPARWAGTLPNGDLRRAMIPPGPYVP